MEEDNHGFKEAIKTRNDNQNIMKGLDLGGVKFSVMIDTDML